MGALQALLADELADDGRGRDHEPAQARPRHCV